LEKYVFGKKNLKYPKDFETYERGTSEGEKERRWPDGLLMPPRVQPRTSGQALRPTRPLFPPTPI
jgi:hypothetical protein